MQEGGFVIHIPIDISGRESLQPSPTHSRSLKGNTSYVDMKIIPMLGNGNKMGFMVVPLTGRSKLKGEATWKYLSSE